MHISPKQPPACQACPPRQVSTLLWGQPLARRWHPEMSKFAAKLGLRPTWTPATLHFCCVQPWPGGRRTSEAPFFCHIPCCLHTSFSQALSSRGPLILDLSISY
jgi:hypothetical protein